MDISVDFSDWSALYPARTEKRVETQKPAAQTTFEQVLRASEEAPQSPEIVQSPEVSQTSGIPQPPEIPQARALPLPASPAPFDAARKPVNIVPDASASVDAPAKKSAANQENLLPLIASADARPGDRLDTEIARTKFHTDTAAQRAALRQSRLASPYNASEEALAKRKESRPLQGVEGMTPRSMDSVRRQNQTAGRPAFNRVPVAADSVTKARDEVKRQTARVEGRQNAERYQNAARQRKIDSGELVSMIPSGADKIGYDRSETPSMVSNKNTAAASWFPEATTRAIDSYEAARKLGRTP